MHGGLGLDHTTLKPWLDPFSKDFSLIYYDHRGNGRSARPPFETLSHKNFVEDAEELRKLLGFHKFILLGHSYGSFIALEYAIRYSQNLSHLILVGTAASYEFLEPCRKNALQRLKDYNLDTNENREVVERWINGEIRDHDEFMRFGELYNQISSPHPDRSTETIFDHQTFNYTIKNCLLKYDLRNELDNINVPTLIINGRNDWDTPIEHAFLVHKGIKNSTFVAFENSEHEPFADEEEAFIKTIKEWIISTE